MALYKRRRSKERPMSLFTGSTSPVLLSYKSDTLPMSQSMSFNAKEDCMNSMSSEQADYPMSSALSDITNTASFGDQSNLDSTLTSYNSEYYEYDLEITELQHSPTFSGKKVWNFSTPNLSPASSRRSGNSSGSLDVTPIARDRLSIKEDSAPPSPASSVSSTLQEFVHRLRSHSSSALETSGNDRRYMIISEVIDTERKYINSLEVLLNIYLPALEHVVAPRDLRLLFPAQLEPLIDKHTNLLMKLEERMSVNTLFPGIVGDIFARLLKESNLDLLNMYSAYMNEFKVAMTTLAKYEQESTQFRELILLCQHSPSCEGLSLASYLLTPIQRLPRYELLLKELLRHTTLDHPDNFYVSDAINLIHQELVRLNQSIKSCQLACTVRRRANTRKESFRVRTGKALAKLKRHVSTANIDDYSSGDSSTGPEVQHARTIRRKRANLKSNYRSEENLLVVDDERRGRGKPFRANSLVNMRPAASLSDLATSYGEDSIKRKPFNLLAPLESLPTTPDPSPRPTSPSESSINPMTSEESCHTRSRLSLYSTASSTSGIGSIENSQFDLRVGSLTPTELTSDPTFTSTPVASPTTFRVGTPNGMVMSSTVEGRVRVLPRETKNGEVKGLKRKSSWTTAFRKLSRKKNGHSYSASKVLDIGSPKNFRHVQHGFPPLPEGIETTHPLSQCKSNASSSNTLNAVHL